MEPDEPVKKAPAKRGRTAAQQRAEAAVGARPAKKAPAKKAPVKKAPAKQSGTPETLPLAEAVSPAAPQPLPHEPPRLATSHAGQPVATTTSLPSSGNERSRIPWYLGGLGLVLLVIVRRIRRR